MRQEKPILSVCYRYEAGFGATLEAGPQVDFIENRVENKESSVFGALWGITVLPVCCCSGLIVKHVYKERPAYLFSYFTIYLLGGFSIYFLLSCIYANLNEMKLRKYGKEGRLFC